MFTTVSGAYWIKPTDSPAIRVLCTRRVMHACTPLPTHNHGPGSGDMKNGGGGWTYVARGNDVSDGAVGSVKTDLNTKGNWHLSAADIAGALPGRPSNRRIQLPSCNAPPAHPTCTLPNPRSDAAITGPAPFESYVALGPGSTDARAGVTINPAEFLEVRVRYDSRHGCNLRPALMQPSG